MLTKPAIEKLNSLLSLPAAGDEQDWEVELADASRIGDFLHAYESMSLTRDDKFALMALIFGSAELRLSGGVDVSPYWERIASILRQERALHQETIRHWACEGENDPENWFFVTPLVRLLEDD